MAILNSRFYKNENEYSDGSVETELLEIVKENKNFDEVLRKDDRWSIFYHLTPLRHNMYSWYPFNPEASLLEVGSGCGAITGLFCEKVKKVTSIELTKNRGIVNYERHKEYDNLEIILGNFHNIEFKEKYDYIILNGVLEYAGSFTKTENPYSDFLKELKVLLKPEGKLLIAIENRLGLKYLNGAVEDHTAQLFSGINDYVDVDFVRTFSKGELKSVIEAAGFQQLQFFYPVPDYKMPEVIYSDESLSLQNANIRDNVYNDNRLIFYNEMSLSSSLSKEGIIDRFFNSFFVEVNNDKAEVNEEKVIYAKMGNDRKPAYQISTLIKKNKAGDLSVIKRPMTHDSEQHLRQMIDYYNNNDCIGNLHNANGKIENNEARFDYITGKTFEAELIEDLESGNVDLFVEKIHQFKNDIIDDNTSIETDYCTSEFIEVFGDTTTDIPFHCKRNSNIDLIFPNIISYNKKYYIIDYEWVFPFSVPLEYVVWRSIYYLFLGNEIVQKKFKIEELLKLFDFDMTWNKIFSAWDNHFGNIYVRDDINHRYEKQIIPVTQDLESLLRSSGKISTLYIDYKKGFNEVDSIKHSIHLNSANGKFCVEFEIPQRDQLDRIYNMRWDPGEYACRIKEVTLSTNNDNDLSFGSDNSTFTEEEWKYFLNNDPSLLICGDYENVRYIKIEGILEPINNDDAIILLNEKMSKSLLKLSKLLSIEKEKTESLIKELDSCTDEKNQYKTQYEIIVNSHVWKVTSPARKLMDKVK